MARFYQHRVIFLSLALLGRRLVGPGSYLPAAIAFLSAASPATALATSQALVQGVDAGLVANPPQSFVLRYNLARVGSDPASMQVYFYLVDPTTGNFSANPVTTSSVYTTPGQYTIAISLPADCYTPASGWKIFAAEAHQTQFGTYSYSNAFSIAQAPPSLSLTALTTQESIVVARSNTALASATDLDTTDTIYYRIPPANVGCATAQNCTYTASLDGQASPNYALPDIGHNQYINNVVQSLGALSAGTHSLKVTVSSGNATSVSATKAFTVVNPALIQVEQPTGTGLSNGVSTASFAPVPPGGSSSLSFTVRNTGGKALNIGSVTIGGADQASFKVTSAPAASVPAGGSTSFALAFVPTTAGNKGAVVHVSSNAAGSANSFDVNLAGKSLTPSESWRLQYFGTTANNGTAADTAVVAGDGLTNLLKYALNLNPLKPAVSPAIVDTSTGFLRLTVPKNPAATDVNFAIQVSGDLAAPGEWTTDGITIDQNSSSLLQAHDNTPLGTSGARFIRLRVTRP